MLPWLRRSPQRLPVGASGHAMEAVFEEFESLLEEATEQAAHVEAVYPHPYFSSGDQGRAAHRGNTCLK